MNPVIDITPDLIQRYDMPLPRYTSYPPVPVWTSSIGAEDYGDKLKGIKTPLSLYIHFPFCRERCRFCGCNAIATENRVTINRYIGALVDELKLIPKTIGNSDKQPKIASIHFGGGSPDYIPTEGRRWILDEIRDNFSVSDRTEIAIEIDPRRINEADLIYIKSHGFNRISFGIQDTDPVVLDAIGRRGDVQKALNLIEAAMELDFRGVSLDMIYGLPYQSWSSFENTLHRIIEIKPHRIILFNFAHLPSKLPHQRSISVESLPSPYEKAEIFSRSTRTLDNAGYSFIGLDHFVRYDDPLALARESKTLIRDFQGYSVGRGSYLIGIGTTSIGHIGDLYTQNDKNLISYLESIEAGLFATSRGYRLSEEDRMRSWIVEQLLCYLQIDADEFRTRWNIPLTHACGKSVITAQQMVKDGLLRISENKWSVTPMGRLFVRNIAHLFDRHTNGGVFSRSI